MKIAIIGAGGVGGYYGALLARAGHEVGFIARGEHLAAIQAKGLAVKSVLGDFAVANVRAAEKAEELGPAELVLVTVKTYGLEAAARQLEPLLGAETAVLPLENGVDSAERIGAIVGMQRMLGGATWLSAAIEAPGLIGHYSQFRRIVLGELDHSRTPRLEKIQAALSQSGAAVETSDDIQKVLWTKLVFIASVAAVGSLARVSFGEYRAIPETRAVLESAMREIAAVAAARGIKLDDDVAAKTLAFFDSSAPGIKPSMQRDVEGGKPSELESLIGAVVRCGREKKVDTPVLSTAYALLKPGQVAAESRKAP